MDGVINYVKAHPIQTGIIAIVGLIIFIVIIRGGSSGGGSGSVQTGPSEAQIAANTAIEVARINAQAAAQQAGAAVSAAQVGAGVQMNSDNRAAEVAMRELEVYESLGIGQIQAQQASEAAYIRAEQERYQSVIGSLGRLKKKDRDRVLETLITGTRAAPRAPNPGNSVGGILQGIGSAAGAILPFFSDDRLKENVRHIGYDRRGRDVYEFNYRGSKRIRRGYIAQQLKRSEPEKVHVHRQTGYLAIQ